MSCFGMATTSSRRGRPKLWRWWRKCAGLASAVHSKLRCSGRAVRWSVPGLDGQRRRTPSSSQLQSGWCHHRSFGPVYVDELYNQAKNLSVVQEHAQEEEPSTSGSKLAARLVDADAAADTARASARASGSKARVGANTSAGVSARASGSKASVDATPSKSAGLRSVLMSPGRGGGGVLGVVKGMGEVDLRAELFIRKFREQMRLQSQKSAEEFQAMLARGL